MCLVASAAILVLCKWALLQRLQPGIHPLFGWMYLRWESFALILGTYTSLTVANPPSHALTIVA